MKKDKSRELVILYKCDKNDFGTSVGLSPERSEGDNHTCARIIFRTCIEHYFLTRCAQNAVFLCACEGKRAQSGHFAHGV